MDDRHSFDFSGGWLCLDFANTLGDLPMTPRDEHLHSYDDLVAWSVEAGLLSDDDAAELAHQRLRRPSEEREAFARAIALRGAIYRIFLAVAADAEPAADDLATVQRVIATAMANARLVPHDGHFHWQFARDTNAFDMMLWPIAWSVAELLTADEVRRVHECAATDCSCLFIDTSKNGSRRWCDMNTCGNRAKARRHRARQTANT